MSDKLNPMGLFLDKFKEVNYVKFADNDYVTSQLRRSTSVNTPGWHGSCIGVARLGGRNK